MPARKGSLDKNLGQKFLDGAKYIGKNFWKVLPLGSGINYAKKAENKLIKTKLLPLAFHILYSTAGLTLLGGYLINGKITHAWTPAQIKEYNRIEKIKSQDEAEHKSEVDYFYNRMFENAKTYQDSVDIYQKYGLPIKLLNPSLSQKEKAIKQNEFERSLN